MPSMSNGRSLCPSDGGRLAARSRALQPARCFHLTSLCFTRTSACATGSTNCVCRLIQRNCTKTRGLENIEIEMNRWEPAIWSGLQSLRLEFERRPYYRLCGSWVLVPCRSED